MSSHLVVCPYCGEEVELDIEADVMGEMIWDCAVCCRPWLVQVTRDVEGDASLWVTRADD